MTENPRDAMVCDAPYLQNEFGDPNFFYVFNMILSFSTSSQSFKKVCTWELLGANVLNLIHTPVMYFGSFKFFLAQLTFLFAFQRSFAASR